MASLSTGFVVLAHFENFRLNRVPTGKMLQFELSKDVFVFLGGFRAEVRNKESLKRLYSVRMGDSYLVLGLFGKKCFPFGGLKSFSSSDIYTTNVVVKNHKCVHFCKHCYAINYIT